jgi:hypothetical protein
MKLPDPSQMRLSRTGLAVPIAGGPARVVERHLAMQAQDFGPAKWSVGQRLGGITDTEVERSFSKGSILRTHVLRPTWHFVSRRDLRWLMQLSGPRVQKGLGPRYRRLALDVGTRTRVEKIIASELAGGALSRKELNEVLRRSHIDTEGQRLPHLLIHCELESVVCSGPRRNNEHTYALFDERVGTGRLFDRDRAMVELVRRYLTGHGPATIKDIGWWSGMTGSDIKEALRAMDTEVDSAEIGGKKLWSLGDATPGPVISRVHLLQAYDELVVGYSESRYLGDPRAEQARSAFMGRSLPTGVVLLGTRIAGHWRRSIRDKKVEVEVLLYASLRGADKIALQDAVEELGRFLNRPAELTTGSL